MSDLMMTAGVVALVTAAAIVASRALDQWHLRRLERERTTDALELQLKLQRELGEAAGQSLSLAAWKGLEARVNVLANFARTVIRECDALMALDAMNPRAVDPKQHRLEWFRARAKEALAGRPWPHQGDEDEKKEKAS